MQALYWNLIDKHHMYDNNTMYYKHLKYNIIISYLYFMCLYSGVPRILVLWVSRIHERALFWHQPTIGVKYKFPTQTFRYLFIQTELYD